MVIKTRIKNSTIQKALKRQLEKFENSKRGNLNAFWGVITIVMVIVISGLLLTVGSGIVQDVGDDQESGSYARNVSTETNKALQSTAQKQSTLSTAGMGIVLLVALIGGIGGFALSRSF